MSQNTTLKLAILLSLLILLGLTILSGYNLFLGKETLFWHIFYILVFILFLAIHIYLKRKKVYNMVKDALNNQYKEVEHSGYLVKKLKHRPLSEICSFLHIDKKQLEPFFNEHHIVIKDYNSSLEDIAKESEYNPLKLLAAIISIDITNKKKVKGE